MEKPTNRILSGVQPSGASVAPDVAGREGGSAGGKLAVPKPKPNIAKKKKLVKSKKRPGKKKKRG